jgi:hypothetical protein
MRLSRRLALALIFLIAPAAAQAPPTALTIHTSAGASTQAHQFALPLDSTPAWTEAWSPGTAATPDAWCAVRPRGDIIEVEYEVSNGSLDPGVPPRPGLSGVSVTVTAPAGYTIVDAAPRPAPTTLPLQRAFQRRLALVPTASLPASLQTATNIAAGTMAPDWQRRRRAYGPGSLPLPALSPGQAAAMAQYDANALAGLRAALANGSTFAYRVFGDGLTGAPVQGWRQWGEQDPAAPGGQGIDLSHGYQDSLHFARLAILASQCCVERQRFAVHRSDGRPLSADDYPDPTPNMHLDLAQPPEFAGVANNDILFDPFWTSHRIRSLRWMIAAHEMTGSPGALRAIVAESERLRLAFSEKGPAPSPGYEPPNARNFLIHGLANPHQGYPDVILGRNVAWPLWAAAYRLKAGPAPSPGFVLWCDMMVRAANATAMPTGICQRVHQVPQWCDAANDSFQAFEASLFWHGIYAVCAQRGRAVPQAALTAASSLYGGSLPILPYYGGWGPVHFPYVAANGGAPYTALTTGQGSSPANPGDPAHVEAFLALAAGMTNDVYWLDLSAYMGGSVYPTWQQKRAALEQADDLGWTAHLLARMQEYP